METLSFEFFVEIETICNLESTHPSFGPDVIKLFHAQVNRV